MSNGLEREFPEVTWQAVPPVGPRGMPAAVVRDHITGDQLHSRTIRDSVRFRLGALGAIIMIGWRSGRVPAKSPSERDTWASSAHGA